MNLKKRIISVAVGFVLLALIFWLINTWVLNVVLAIFSVLAVFEALRALRMNDNILALVLYVGAGILGVLLAVDMIFFVFGLLLLTFCLIMFSQNRHYTFKEGAAAYVMTLTVVLGLRAILRLRGLFIEPWDMRFALLIALALGWICDTFAFFFGFWLGKRKLCPAISPKKTVAGAVAGLIGTPIVITGVYLLYTNIAPGQSVFYLMNDFPKLAFFFGVGLLGAAIGMVGDLAASFVKRECGVKDFGNLIPGHGGALDRLDSVLFTAVFALAAFEIYFRLFVLLGV